MTSEVLNNIYLDYLEPQVVSKANTDETYRDLLHLMSETEFVWLVPNDDNRIGDGMDIRAEWFDHVGSHIELGPCSFLEVLVGLSRRMGFLTSEDPEGWAWQLIINLELHRMHDPLSRYKTKKAIAILESVIWRTYSPTGEGGFFPLIKPKEDQRKVELWYQMNAYINEIHPEF